MAGLNSILIVLITKNKVCPACAAKMDIKRFKKGKVVFYVCSRCRLTINKRLISQINAGQAAKEKLNREIFHKKASLLKTKNS